MAKLKVVPPKNVNTAAVVAAGLLGGYVAASQTGIRTLGGAILGAAGLWAGRSWLDKTDGKTTAFLGTLYLGGFGLSHPLAKKIGAWPAVFAVTAVSSTAAYLHSDLK